MHPRQESSSDRWHHQVGGKVLCWRESSREQFHRKGEARFGDMAALSQPTANLTLDRYEFAFDTLRALKPLTSKLVFDIGSGEGQMRRIESFGLSWHGFDLNPSPGSQRWDLNEPYSGSLLPPGAVLLLDVIEHCVNPGLALKNIAAILLPNTPMIMTMPNPRWSRSRVHALFHGVPACFTQADLDINHHVFTPWPHIMEKMLRDVGFVIENYVTLDGTTRVWDRPISITYPLRCLNSLSHVLIEKIDRSACGMSFGLTVRKI